MGKKQIYNVVVNLSSILSLYANHRFKDMDNPPLTDVKGWSL